MSRTEFFGRAVPAPDPAQALATAVLAVTRARWDSFVGELSKSRWEKLPESAKVDQLKDMRAGLRALALLPRDVREAALEEARRG